MDCVESGVAREREPVSVDRRPLVCGADNQLGAGADARVGTWAASAGDLPGPLRRCRSSRSSRSRRSTASDSRRSCGDGTSRRNRDGRRLARCRWAGCGRREPIPEKTSRGNFTAHWGAGVRLRPRGAHAVVVAYRFQHFSNGNQLGSNPGVNSHVVLIGWSLSARIALRRLRTRPIASPDTASDPRGTSSATPRGSWRRRS